MKFLLNLLWCKLFISCIQKNWNDNRSPKATIFLACMITQLIASISCTDDHLIHPEPRNPLCLLDSIIYKVNYSPVEYRFHYRYTGDRIEKIVQLTDKDTAISHFYYSGNQLDSIRTTQNGTHIRSVTFVREGNIISRYEIKRDEWDGYFYRTTMLQYHFNSRNEAEKIYYFMPSDNENWVKINNYQKFTWKNGNMVLLEVYEINNKKSETGQNLFQHFSGWKIIKEAQVIKNSSINPIKSFPIINATIKYSYDKMRNPIERYPIEARLDLDWLFPGRNNLTSVHISDSSLEIDYSYEYNEKKFPVIRIGQNTPMGYSDTIFYYYSFR